MSEWIRDRQKDQEMANSIIKDYDQEIKRLQKTPQLGCATTAELIDELKARSEVDGTLNYRTIDEEME